MNQENTLTVKITGQTIIDMQRDISQIKEMLEKGQGKISNNKENISLNRKLIYGAYSFTTAAIAFILGFLLRVKP